MLIKSLLLTYIFILMTVCYPNDPASELTVQIDKIVQERNLRGIQIQITRNNQSIYYHDKGIKNQRNQPIDQDTMFRIASLSKSFSSVSIMRLVQQGKLKLNDSISSILGFEVKNPHYPDVPITVQMILSHQSSISEPDKQYSAFLTATYNSQDGSSVPQLRQILTPSGKYYNVSMFPAGRKPGEYFSYSNLGYVIAGTIIEKVTNKRFDIYQQENVLSVLSEGLTQNATYNVGTIKDYKNLGCIYSGNQGKWVPNIDNYNGTIPQRNLTQYKIGTNGGVFGPQGGLRASVKHLNNYMYVLMNKGMMKNGKRLLSQESVNQILRPRYQYHGSSGGVKVDFHLYGLGIYTTSYSKSDILIEHEVVRGHLGDAYGLISGYHFWKQYSFSYIINGALNGYKYDSSSIYQLQRSLLHKSVDSFIQKITQYQHQTQQLIKVSNKNLLNQDQ